MRGRERNERGRGNRIGRQEAGKKPVLIMLAKVLPGSPPQDVLVPNATHIMYEVNGSKRTQNNKEKENESKTGAPGFSS